MLTSAKFALILALFLHTLSLISTQVGNLCLCDPRTQNCTNDNVTIGYFAMRAFLREKNMWNIEATGVVSCWDSGFAPVSIAIVKCGLQESVDSVIDRINPQEQPFTSNFLADPQAKLLSLYFCMREGSEFNAFMSSGIFAFMYLNLQSPEKVMKLIVQNVLVSLDSNSLRKFTNIDSLFLLNLKLKEIPFKLLEDNKKLNRVNISGNNIRVITPEDFTNQGKLRSLVLSYNKINSFGISCNKSTALNLPSLGILDLRYNNIAQLCNNAFQATPRLKYLFLQHNEITSLQDVFVSDLDQLIFLNLGHNKLETISEMDFMFLKHLISLNLPSNHIKTVEKLAFKNLDNLRHLNLDDNFLDFKYNSAPYFPRGIQTLSLKRNHLEIIPTANLADLVNLVDLYVNGNHIFYTKIDDYNFFLNSSNFNERRVYLQNNALLTFDLQGYEPHQISIEPARKILFHLDENPLRCDCSVRTLHKCARNGFYYHDFHVNFSLNNLHCHLPKALKNELFVSLDNSLLLCRRADVCPVNCTCNPMNFDTGVNCERGMHYFIPSVVPVNSTSLIMSFNPISSLENLWKWKFLRKLELSNCPNLQNVLWNEYSVFMTLPNLEELFLENNNLTALHPSLFINLTNLLTLQLGFNSLTSLPETVGFLRKLQRISVETNQISGIKSTIFEHNVLLREINFRHNNLSHVHLNISHLEQLTSVDFSHNNLVSFEIFWPNSADRIILSNNRINSVDLSTFPPDLQFLDLSHNELQEIDVDTIDRFSQNVIIDVNHNKITNIKSRTRFSNSSLPTANEPVISLNHNPISCDCDLATIIEYLTNASDSGNKNRFDVDNLYCYSPEFMKNKRVSKLDISKLPCRDFPYQKYPVDECNYYKWKASEYRILVCDGATRLPDVVAITNEIYLRNGTMNTVLELAKLNWTELQVISFKYGLDITDSLPRMFTQMKYLMTVDFAHNKNLMFSSEVFSQLLQLVNLDLSYNGIVKIQRESFDGDANLRHFFLSHNLIEDLPETIFTSLTQLLQLDISHNKLRSLSKKLFENSQQLETLIVGHNLLTSIDSNIFQSCRGLTVLDFGDNNLRNGALRGLDIPSSVRTLNISRNNLTELEEKWIIQLPNLQELDLGFNQIDVLNLRQLVLYPMNININLQQNNISMITWFENPRKVLHNSFNDRFPEFGLYGNPFNCDCNLKPFISYLKDQKQSPVVFIRDGLKCFQPQHLSDRILTDAEERELYCAIDICPCGCECRITVYNITEMMCKFSNMKCLLSSIVNVNRVFLYATYNLTKLYTAYWKTMSILKLNVCSFTGNISSDFLQNHPKLEELTLRRCNLSYVPDGLFVFTPGLTSIDLSDNFITSLSPDIFRNLPKLLKLDLSNNKLRVINWQIPILLESLNLARNEIIKCTIPKLNVHYNLKYLNISYNRFKSVPNTPTYLFHLKNLVTLDISYNNITINCNDISTIFPLSLNTLNVSNNNLKCTNFWQGTSKLTSNLKLVDFGFNPITDFSLSNFYADITKKKVMVDLRHCELVNYSLDVVESKSDDWSFLLVVDVTNNQLIECDCEILPYVNPTLVQVKDHVFKLQLITNKTCRFNFQLDNASQFDIIPNSSACAIKSKCPISCQCLYSLDDVKIYCVRLGLKNLPSTSLSNVTYLNVNFNSITVLDGLSDEQWRSLVVISARHNEISAISNENVLLLRSLRGIFLDGNQLHTPSGWLKNLVDTDYLSFKLTLSNNPWTCDCDNLMYQKWLRTFSARNLILDAQNISCDGNPFLNTDICLTELWKILLPTLLITCIVLIILPLTVFYYRNKSAVLVWIFSKKLCVCCITEDKIDDDKEYDAFLSYAHEDSEFVIGELLPGLEDNEPFYKICIHERDWIAGEAIVELIETSIKNSRRVIIVLSENFVESMWANVEFKFANYQSIQDKINRVIIIALDDNLPMDKLDQQFKSYVNMHSYLKASNPQFWSKLRFLMPRKKVEKKCKLNRSLETLVDKDIEEDVV